MASVDPAEKPRRPMRVTPKREAAFWASQRAAVSQSSGAAGHGCSGASR